MSNQVEVVRLNRLDGDGPIKAFCDIALFGSLILKGFKVVDGKNGTFVGMPSERGKDGQWYNTIYLLNRDMKQVIENTVLEAYAA